MAHLNKRENQATKKNCENVFLVEIRDISIKPKSTNKTNNPNTVPDRFKRVAKIAFAFAAAKRSLYLIPQIVLTNTLEIRFALLHF